ncbi:MAG TPA: ATP-binding cassette domain-containing protein [Chthoniobacterales bacterium]|jgi:multiple sugar transport system ATP-binding protein
MASVSVKSISKTYAGAKRTEVMAINDVSLEIADHQFVVLVGPAGCGKSTILRTIAGLEKVSKGEIYIGDKRVNDVAPKDRDVAMVFPDYALYPHMTVGDNLAFGLKLRKFSGPESKRRVSDAASILGIDSLLSQKPGALDSSQRQRVALGRAVVRQPKVFLLDDPLSNLESTARRQMRGELIKLHQRLQATMIYVTQDSVEAMMMADQVVVLKDGAVQQADTPLAVYRQPANLFVAGYFGSPSMNLVAGRLRQDGDKLRFDEVGGGTISIIFPRDEQPAAQNFSNANVIFGIRPEDLQIAKLSRKEVRAAGNSFPAIVDLVEPMGAETHLCLNTGAHSLSCRSCEPFDRGEAGHRFQFEVNLARAHFFDPETTNRLF